MLTSSRRSVASRFAALSAGAVLAVGLGVATGTPAGATTPRAKGASVTIKNLAFSPKTLTVKAGSKVTVKKPGTYAYHCNIHDFMKGTIKAT